jgi:hypothetical protein
MRISIKTLERRSDSEDNNEEDKGKFGKIRVRYKEV